MGYDEDLKGFEGHSSVQWFSGGHFEEGAEARGCIRALGIVRQALLACPNRDMRDDDMLGRALNYLRIRHLDKPVLADRFMRALDIEQPEQRFQAALTAFENLAKATRRNIARSLKYG